MLTNRVADCDDAQNVFVAVASSAAGAVYQVQVSPFDPTLPESATIPLWFTLLSNATSSAATVVALAPGQATILNAPAFHGLRISTTGADAAGAIIGFASKQVMM